MLFTLELLREQFPSYEGTINNKQQITHMMTDSRKEEKNALFIPIIGENFDGHHFIHDAISAGAVATLWGESVPIPKDVADSFPIFLVEDTVEALQKLAKVYLKQINPIVIGITGSNGKTTTKDLLKSVLQTTFNTYATVGNFNNHLGLPLTILQMRNNTEVLVLEMGMNDFGEIDLLTKIAEPNYAIITNVGESHIEHLGSREGIAKAKLEIKNGLQKDGLLIIDGDEQLLTNYKSDEKTITCGFNRTNDVIVSNVQFNNVETTFSIGEDQFTIPLLGKHHALNASFVIAIARKLAIRTDDIHKGLKSLDHSNMRFELLKGKNGVSLINDAYNASPTSMKAAIEVVKQMQGFKTKIVVLGDILELGSYAKDFHESVATSIDSSIDIVYTYGDNAKYITEKVNQSNENIKSTHLKTKEQLVETLQKHVEKDTLILFKASRGMAFEQLVKQLM